MRREHEAAAAAKAGQYLDGDEHDVHRYPDESRGPQDEKGVHRTHNHEDGDGGWQGTKQGSFKQGIAIAR